MYNVETQQGIIGRQTQKEGKQNKENLKRFAILTTNISTDILQCYVSLTLESLLGWFCKF
jgi:hypothetical protein